MKHAAIIIALALVIGGLLYAGIAENNQARTRRITTSITRMDSYVNAYRDGGIHINGSFIQFSAAQRESLRVWYNRELDTLQAYAEGLEHVAVK